jgi:hypothetical protein
VSASRGRGQRGGFGRGNRGGRHGGWGNQGTPRQTRMDSHMIRLTDGTQVEYRAWFSFPCHVFMKMKPEDEETLKQERPTYQEYRHTRNKIQELRSQVQELGAGTVATQTKFTAYGYCFGFQPFTCWSTHLQQSLDHGRAEGTCQQQQAGVESRSSHYPASSQVINAKSKIFERSTSHGR